MTDLLDKESTPGDPYTDLCGAIAQAFAANVALQRHLGAHGFPVADTGAPPPAADDSRVLPFVRRSGSEHAGSSSESGWSVRTGVWQFPSLAP
jgi:hypothetical protein